MTPVPTEIVEAFGELNATLTAVQDVIEDVIQRKEALRDRINHTPELCADGVVGDATGEVMETSGWVEVAERLELIAATIGEGAMDLGWVIPAPDWYVQRQDERARWIVQQFEAREELQQRVEELERVVFDLTTADTD